jgi:cytoskeletal protein CcmA (bactofilin family)
MWKRDESEIQENTRAATSRMQYVLHPPASPPMTPPAPAAPAPEAWQNLPQGSTIGETVVVKGELTAGEDLTIEGHVEGKISLQEHVLTIGSHGRIQAEVFAKTVIVLGEVRGNITANELIDIRVNGSVTGNIKAVRVSIAEGAYFLGGIDMQRKADAMPAPEPGAGTPESPASEPQAISF